VEVLSPKFKVALIGGGRIADRHAQVLNSHFQELIEVVGFSEIIDSKREAFQAKHKIRGFANSEEMLQESQPDVSVILTESGNHHRDAIISSKFCKVVLIEKPMALRVEDADLILEAGLRNKCDIFVVKQNRFNLPILKTRDAISRNLLGDLILGTVRVRWSRDQSYYDQAKWRGTWKLDGGVLANQASHHIDMLVWMLGEPISVLAQGRKALAEIEAEDTAVGIVEFANGGLGLIEATTAVRPRDLEGSISILGSKGSIEVGGFAMNQLKVWNVPGQEIESENLNSWSQNPPDVYGFGHKTLYENVVAKLNGESHDLVSGIEGRLSLEVIAALYESMEKGKKILLPSPGRHSRLGIS
jgi:UDP-N-acetyl-2-amino-2-deoxyglucuronate dehydrogenase